jgi:hypothetical protein
MGLLVYCVGGRDHPGPGTLTGVAGVTVRAEAFPPLSVWLSELKHAPVASLDGVRAHNTVVEAATADRTPLPFRFGQYFESRDSLAESLRQQEAELIRKLQHVEGCLEHGLRILDPHAPDPPPDRSSGTAYLEGLARRARRDQLEQERGREIVQGLRERLGPLVRDQRVRYVGGGTLAVVAYLVSRHDTGKYHIAMSSIPDEWPDLRFHSTGPWPPYGFVE